VASLRRLQLKLPDSISTEPGGEFPGSEELTMATIYKKVHAEEIEQVIAEYLAAKHIAGRTPGDVAHEIVEVARVAVPKARRRLQPLDCSKLSTAVAAALEKLGRNEPLRQPVTRSILPPSMSLRQATVAWRRRRTSALNIKSMRPRA
jgi:hypothetical protein